MMYDRFVLQADFRQYLERINIELRKAFENEARDMAVNLVAIAPRECYI